MKKQQVGQKAKPGFKGKIKDFFRITFAKLLITFLILFYGFYFFATSFYGPVYSILPIILFVPLLLIIKLTGLVGVGLILAIPYTYLISCLIIGLFNITRKIKWVWILFILIFFVLAGLDEPLINNTVNKPDYSCNVDSDCIVKDTINGWCGNTKCVNKDWNYYSSLVNSAFALSCIPNNLLSCSCVENTCKTTDIYRSSNPEDCNQFSGESKDRCLLVVTNNKNGIIEG